jgi:hypothetical protein
LISRNCSITCLTVLSWKHHSLAGMIQWSNSAASQNYYPSKRWFESFQAVKLDMTSISSSGLPSYNIAKQNHPNNKTNGPFYKSYINHWTSAVKTHNKKDIVPPHIGERSPLCWVCSISIWCNQNHYGKHHWHSTYSNILEFIVVGSISTILLIYSSTTITKSRA